MRRAASPFAIAATAAALSVACTNEDLSDPTTSAGGGSGGGADSTGSATASDTSASATSGADTTTGADGDGSAGSGGEECADQKTQECQAYRYIVWCAPGAVPGVDDDPDCITHDPSDPEPSAACFGPTGTVDDPEELNIYFDTLPVCLPEGTPESSVAERCKMECEASSLVPPDIDVGGVTYTGHVWCWTNGGGSDPYIDDVGGSCTWPESGPAQATGKICGPDTCDELIDDCPDYELSGATYTRSGYTFYASLDYDWVWDTGYPNPGILFACDQGRFSFYDDTFYNLTTDSIPYDLGFRTGDHTLKAWEHDPVTYNRIGDAYTLDTLTAAIDAMGDLFPESEDEVHITFQVTSASSTLKTIHVDIEP